MILYSQVANGSLTRVLPYSKGYIPLDKEDPNVLAEQEREAAVGMSKCICSNCNQSGAIYLINHFKYLTNENFDSYILDEETKDPKLTFPIQTRLPSILEKKVPTLCSMTDPIRFNPAMIDLTKCLQLTFETHFKSVYGDYAPVQFDCLFKIEHAWMICKNLQSLTAGMPLHLLFGSQPVVGSHEAILNCIHNWINGDVGVQHMNDIESAQIEKDQVELNIILEEEANIQKKKDNEIKKAECLHERKERKKNHQEKKERKKKRRAAKAENERRYDLSGKLTRISKTTGMSKSLVSLIFFTCGF